MQCAMANGIGTAFDPNDMSSWYFGGLSRAEATEILLAEKESGVFLVRDSRTIHGDYVLCVRENERVSNYIINRVVGADGNARFRIGEQMFSDMGALLAFYRLHYLDTTPLVRPVRGGVGGVTTAVAPAPSPPVLEVVVAKFDFNGNDPEDLSFRRGERLAVVSRDEDKWWTARNQRGDTGLIPVPYVQRLGDGDMSLTERPHTNMQRTLPARARVRQSRVPNAYDKTALKLEEGQILTVLKMNINGQWEGELNGKVGHFPFTHVEFLDDPAQHPNPNS